MKRILFAACLVCSIQTLSAQIITVGESRVDTIITVTQTQEIAQPIVEEPEQSPRLVYIGCKAYLDDQLVTKEDYNRYIRALSNVDQIRYKQAQPIRIAGWSMFGGGLGLFTIGGICFIISDLVADWYTGASVASCGIVFMSLSVPIVTCSVPLICVGEIRTKNIKKKALDHYIQSTSTPITYNITAGENGVGLAINF